MKDALTSTRNIFCL